jgi:hypothetical protein
VKQCCRCEQAGMRAPQAKAHLGGGQAGTVQGWAIVACRAAGRQARTFVHDCISVAGMGPSSAVHLVSCAAHRQHVPRAGAVPQATERKRQHTTKSNTPPHLVSCAAHRQHVSRTGAVLQAAHVGTCLLHWFFESSSSQTRPGSF